MYNLLEVEMIASRAALAEVENMQRAQEAAAQHWLADALTLAIALACSGAFGFVVAWVATGASN